LRTEVRGERGGMGMREDERGREKEGRREGKE
jgi:hypothetical protein